MLEQREFIREEEIITADQIEIITGLDSEGAIREFDHLLKTLNNGSNEILLDDYCRARELDPIEVFYCLNPPQAKWTIELEGEDEFQDELDRHFRNHEKTHDEHTIDF